MFKIGYRTIKTAIGTPISIFLSQSLGLLNASSAGIITILCIQPTKKKSLSASWERFLACMIAMVFSSVLFELLGYHPFVIGLLLLFFIPTVVKVKAQSGIVTSSVIILHIYTAGNFTFDLFLNEVGIISIGVGVALLMNLYMPSVELKLDEYVRKIENNFTIIFTEVSHYLRLKESNWAGQEITETAELLKKAKRLAILDTENRLTITDDNKYYDYFRMREKQFEIIEQVLPIVAEISVKVEQAHMIAEFIDEVAENIKSRELAPLFLDKLANMKESFASMDLPKTREEFEVRAELLHFVNEMERYLLLKRNYVHKNKDEND